MNYGEYREHDAVALAALVACGEVRAEELLDLAIARRAEVEDRLNTTTVDDEAFARRTLENGVPDGPFAGVPFLLKDLYAFLKATRISNGSRLVRAFEAGHDSTLVARLRRAGLVIFGKTNSPEFGLNVTTEPVLHGPTRNPWNPAHIAGGSSGAAVHVAVELAREMGKGKVILVPLPDGGRAYISKVYNDEWMRENGFLDAEGA